jgi:predicted Ser/Thr protein kinase
MTAPAPAAPEDRYALSPPLAFGVVALFCFTTALVTWALQRPPTIGPLAVGTLVLQGGISVMLTASFGLTSTPVVVGARIFALAVLGLMAAVPYYFFGPFGGLAIVFVLLLALAGVLSGSTGAKHPALAGWVTYAALASGQAAVSILVLSGTLPDRGLIPFLPRGSTPALEALAHIGLQGVFLVAFLAGRAFQRRYRALASRVDEAIRTTTIRETLLGEARAEYRQAVTAARWALARPGEPPPRPPRRQIPIELPPLPEAPSAAAPWLAAHRSKMVLQNAAMVVLCLVVGALTTIMVDDALPLAILWACVAGIFAAALLQRWLVRRHRDETVYWPWVVITVLTFGPAYAFGLHSGVPGAIGLMLFLGGLFRAGHRARNRDRRNLVLAGVCASHFAVFAAIWLGLLPDVGHVPVRTAGAPYGEPIALQLLVQSGYVLAFAAGVIVDRRYEQLARDAERAVRHAARQDALLAASNAEVDRLLGGNVEAIFAKQQIGRFRLERQIGRGGMGEVYEGVDVDSGTKVAVKLVRRDLAAHPEALKLLAEEASTLARVRSPYVAEVLGVAGTEDDLPYIAMEFIDGRSLQSMITERERLPIGEVRAMVHDIALGLAAVHAAGIVHRDVKPSNIMRTEVGGETRWKLVDFGVAQIHEIVGAPGDSPVVGTPGYMSPEQALNERLDARADLYSFCLVLYRTLTGRSAFIGEDRVEIAQLSRDRGPPHPRWFAALPADVELVLRLGLSARKEDRFETAAELAAAFEGACDDRLAAPVRARALELLVREPWTEPMHVDREEHLTETRRT